MKERQKILSIRILPHRAILGGYQYCYILHCVSEDSKRFVDIYMTKDKLHRADEEELCRGIIREVPSCEDDDAHSVDTVTENPDDDLERYINVDCDILMGPNGTPAIVNYTMSQEQLNEWFALATKYKDRLLELSNDKSIHLKGYIIKRRPSDKIPEEDPIDMNFTIREIRVIPNRGMQHVPIIELACTHGKGEVSYVAFMYNAGSFSKYEFNKYVGYVHKTSMTNMSAVSATDVKVYPADILGDSNKITLPCMRYNGPIKTKSNNPVYTIGSHVASRYHNMILKAIDNITIKGE